MDLYEKVQFFKVLDPVWFSDHCPVKMSLTIGHSIDENPINRSEFVGLDETFQWSEEGSYKFSEMLNSEHIQKRLQEEVIESNINSIIINGLKEDSEKSTKEQVLEHLKLILTNPDEQVNLDMVKRMGRKNKENQIRPISVKFKDYHIKENIIYSGKCDLNSISLKDNSNSNAFSGIQLVQDTFIKFTLNLPKNCSNFISRSEVGKFPLNVKIWTQMVKYSLDSAKELIMRS